MSQELKDHLIENVKSARHLMLSDLKAMSHEQLALQPGGGARAAYDYVHEVSVVNMRIAAVLRGEEPGPWPYEGWVTAPEDQRTPEAAASSIDACSQAVIDALGDFPAERLNEEMQRPSGPTTARKMADLVAVHMMYHDGQLNLVQAMTGDQEVHWD